MNTTIGIALVLLVLVVAFVWTTRNYEFFPSVSDQERLLQKAASWAIRAEQNPSPQDALVQSSIAMGYLYALQDLAPESELDRRIDFPDFRKRIQGIHDTLVQSVKCTR